MKTVCLFHPGPGVDTVCFCRKEAQHMFYHGFNGAKLSVPGLGCMRLPTPETDGQIDIGLLGKMVSLARKPSEAYHT